MQVACALSYLWYYPRHLEVTLKLTFHFVYRAWASPSLLHLSPQADLGEILDIHFYEETTEISIKQLPTD